MTDHFELLLQKLNPGQRQAVETLEGPVLVIAGPGTGKTQVLAMRIANILRQTDTRPGNILCLTFTESGVLAMRKRLQSIVGAAAYHVKVHTFHSFCNEVIQAFPEKFAFAKDLTQLDDLNRIKLMREMLDKPELNGYEIKHLRPFHNPFNYQSDIVSAIQNLKREGFSAEKFMQEIESEYKQIESNPDINAKTGKPKKTWQDDLKKVEKNLDLAHVYIEYQKILNERGFYDYEDMILFVIENFKKDDSLLAHYQEQFLYILVDEYQDTNGSQNEIIRLLGSFDSSPNIFAVGDDDQAIYRFQGANVENLLEFTKQFENVQTIPITVNHRSSQLILDAANSVIKNNKMRLVNFIPNLSKDLKSAFDIPDLPIDVYALPDADQENQLLINKIKDLNANGVKFDDIAILYRRHRDAEDTIQALAKAGIPLRVNYGSNALEEKAIRQLINFLKVIEYADEQRDLLLFEVLFYDFLKLKRLDVFKVTHFASDNRYSIFNVIANSDYLQQAGVEEPEKFQKFVENLANWKAADANLTLVEFMEVVMHESGYINYLFGEKFTLEDANAVNSFYNYIRELNRSDRQIRIADLLSDIRLLEENNLSVVEKGVEADEEGVHMSTAHGAKGLEFKNVFVIKFYDGNWGGYSRREVIKLPNWVFEKGKGEGERAKEEKEIEAIEDERRLLFVALTRAKERIYISYANQYPSGNSVKEVVPSQFLSEIGSEYLVNREIEFSVEDQSSFLKQQLSPLITKDYSKAEEAYLKKLASEFRLSATALNTYLDCPLRFKFENLIELPRVKSNNEVLGSAVHYALEKLMQLFREKGEGERLKGKEYLIEMFNRYLGKEILAPERLQEIRSEGEEILSAYYDNYATSFTVPIAMEYSFRSHNVVMDIEGQPVQLTGKLDKFEWVEKELGTVKITDYKTTTPKSENELRGLTKNADNRIWNQIVFYKLITDLDDGFRPSASQPKYTVDTIEIDFMKPNSSGKYKREAFQILDTDTDALKETIKDVVTRIRKLEFGSDKYPLCEECAVCKMFS